jgi:hypothetical protein
MDSLDVFRMIVSPSSVHAPGMDAVGYHVAVIGELSITECAFAVLGDNLPVEELPHLAVGAKFPVSPGMLRVLDPADAHPALALFSWDLLSSAAEVGAVDRAEFIPAESHGCLLIGFGGLARWERDEESCSFRRPLATAEQPHPSCVDILHLVVFIGGCTVSDMSCHFSAVQFEQTDLTERDCCY